MNTTNAPPTDKKISKKLQKNLEAKATQQQYLVTAASTFNHRRNFIRQGGTEEELFTLWKQYLGSTRGVNTIM